MSLEHCTVIVTGAASGIGAATVRRFHAHGAQVVALDLSGDGVQQLASGLDGTLGLQVDVTDPRAVDRAVGRAVDHLGGLTTVVNCAGIDDPEAKRSIAAAAESGSPLQVTEGLSDERWRRMLAVNLDGPFHLTRATLPHLVASGNASIVNIASVAGMQGRAGYPHYSASKAGVIGLTQAVAREVASQGVRVNAICPGPVATGMAARSSERLNQAVIAEVPTGRVAQAEEVATVVTFLASDAASYITGATLPVDGGMLTV